MSNTDSSKRRDLTSGAVDRHLANLAMPMVWGIVASMSTSLADAYFLAQLGTPQLAAISFTFPVVFAFTSLAIGLSAGAASVVSRAIGESNIAAVRRLATDSLLLAVLIVLVFCVLGWFTIEPLFRLLGADGEVLDHIKAYMEIWYLGMPFLVVPMAANGLLRAAGDSFVPSLIMIAAAVINLVLDPIFIFGAGPIPPLGVEGAAWASLVARAGALVLSVSVLIRRENLLTFELPGRGVLWASWRRVMAVGLPAAAGNMMNPIGIGIVTSILSVYGAETVAAFGAATRIEAFAAIPVLALSAAIGPISGQNWGADKPERIARALQVSFAFSLGWAFVVLAGAWLAGPWLATQFSGDAVIQKQIADYLLVVATSLAGYGVIVVAAGCCNAIGRPLYALGFYFGRIGVLYVPLVWIAARMFDVTGVFWAIWLANVAGGLAAALIIWRMMHTMVRREVMDELAQSERANSPAL